MQPDYKKILTEHFKDEILDNNVSNISITCILAMIAIPFDLAFARGGRRGGRGGMRGGRMGGASSRTGASRMTGGSRSEEKQRERDRREDGKTYRRGLESDRE